MLGKAALVLLWHLEGAAYPFLVLSPVARFGRAWRPRLPRQRLRRYAPAALPAPRTARPAHPWRSGSPDWFSPRPHCPPSVNCSVRKFWNVDRSGATHFRMKSISPFSMWHSRTSGQSRQRCFKGRQIDLGLTLQPHHGEDLHLEPQFARVDIGVIALDIARLPPACAPGADRAAPKCRPAWPVPRWSSGHPPAIRPEYGGRSGPALIRPWFVLSSASLFVRTL